jgi:DNA-binding NarL/FixJ family response regulator
VGEAGGQEAIDLAVSLEPDLILMDIAMQASAAWRPPSDRKRVPRTQDRAEPYGRPEYVRRFLKVGVSGTC